VSIGHGPDPCPLPALPSALLEVSRLPHAVGCFLAALATGWPWLTALLAFRCLDRGCILEDSRFFLCTGCLACSFLTWCMVALHSAPLEVSQRVLRCSWSTARLRRYTAMFPSVLYCLLCSRLLALGPAASGPDGSLASSGCRVIPPQDLPSFPTQTLRLSWTGPARGMLDWGLSTAQLRPSWMATLLHPGSPWP